MMMRAIKPWTAALRVNSRGAVAIEFAFIAPVFLLLIIGISQLGLAFLASAGLRHAVETGARYAQVYPSPTDQQVSDKVRGSAFGLDTEQITDVSVTTGTSNGISYRTISMSYNFPLNFVMMPSHSFTLSYSRRAYAN